MRKIEYNEIKKYIEGDNGNKCKLAMTEDEFEIAKKEQQKSNTTVKLKIKCECTNIFTTEYNTFKILNKKQCNECSKKYGKKRTISNEQFLNKVKEVKGNEYEILEKYVRSDKKILIRHNCKKCNNYEFRMTPSSFISDNQGCPKCSGRMKKSTDEFKQEVFNLENDKYSVLSEYINNKTKLLMKHNCEKCNNYEYLVTPSDFLTGYRCPKCYGNIKKTHEEFMQEVYDLVGHEYTIVGKYINYATKVKFIHNNKSCDNYEFEMKPNSFFSGQRCPKCAGVYKRTIEEYKNNVHKQVNDEYSVLGDYENQTTKILMRHNCDKCNNYEWEIMPYSFLDGARCPKCAGSMRKTTDEFKKEIYNLVGNEYEVLGEYINIKTKILIKHNCETCNNHIYPVSPTNFIYSGSRCPICAESKGEQKVRYYLQNNNIKYIYQYIFENLTGINNGLLKFDFAIFYDIEKTKLRMLIEYDGIFHYEKQYEDDGFETIQIHDKLKNEYCKNNNIPLLRIPYWEFDNIEEILKRDLKLIEKIS